MRGLTTRFTGLLLVALGVWGGLVPFIGHYFHFAMGPDRAWSWTTGRLWLDVLPGAVTVLGGLNLMSAGPRRSARLGALLALAGGIWFAIGPEISQLWTTYGDQGAAHGSAHIRMLEMLAYHTGLGVVVAALAGYALPRFPADAVEAAAARRWYHEPGALATPGARSGTGEEPVGRRHRGEGAAAAGAGAVGGAALARHEERKHDERAVGDEPATTGGRDHHRGGEVAAAGAGAVGGAALAHHEERKHDERAVGDEPATTGGRDHHRGGEVAAAGAGAVGGAALAHHEERKHDERALTDESATTRGPLAGEPATTRQPIVGDAATTRDGAAGGDPIDDTADRAPVGDMAGDAPATTAYPDREHSVRRRRRGGLLSGLLRR